MADLVNASIQNAPSERGIARAMWQGAINSFKSPSMWVAIAVGAALTPLIIYGMHGALLMAGIHAGEMTVGGASIGAALGAGIMAVEGAVSHAITHATTEVAHEGLAAVRQSHRQRVLERLSALRSQNTALEAKFDTLASAIAHPDPRRFQFDHETPRSPKIAVMVESGAARGEAVKEIVAKGIERERRMAEGGHAAAAETGVAPGVVYR